MNVSVTAVIKAKNEEHQIVDAIRSAKYLADEIIVVDDGSTDKTVTRALSAGARIIAGHSTGGRINELDKTGFEAANGHWVLRLDADERLTEELASTLRSCATDNLCDAVSFPRRNVMFGGWPRHGGWFVSSQVRFFRRSAYDKSWTADAHTQVPVFGNILHLKTRPENSTWHLNYDTVSQFCERTLWRYSAVEASDRYRKGERFGPVRSTLLPLKKFVGRYFIRRGFLDGRRGLVLALLLSAYETAIQCQLWDLARTGTSTPEESHDQFPFSDGDMQTTDTPAKAPETRGS